MWMYCWMCVRIFFCFSLFFVVQFILLILFRLIHTSEFGISLLNKTQKKERKKWKQVIPFWVCVRTGWFLLVFVILFYKFVICLCICLLIFYNFYVLCVAIKIISCKHTQLSCVTDSSYNYIYIVFSVCFVLLLFMLSPSVHMNSKYYFSCFGLILMCLSVNFNFFFSIFASLSQCLRAYLFFLFTLLPRNSLYILIHMLVASTICVYAHLSYYRVDLYVYCIITL